MLRILLLRKRFAAFAAIGMLATASQSASALVAEIDEFTVWKNQALIFQDTFSDNVAPPAAPGELATYLFPVGGISESNGKAYLNAAQGELRPNAVGALSNVTRITFSTNIVPTESTGLKSDQLFQTSAVFTLLDNTVAGDIYGIRLTDRNALGQLGVGNSGNDVLELRISRSSSGESRLQFRTQDYLTPNGAIITHNAPLIPSSYFSIYDSVELIFKKENPSSSTIDASAVFRGLMNGAPVSQTILMGSTDAFHGENWTRAELFAAQAPIPEPETYAMFLTGVALVGWQLRRKSKQSHAAAIR